MFLSSDRLAQSDHYWPAWVPKIKAVRVLFLEYIKPTHLSLRYAMQKTLEILEMWLTPCVTSAQEIPVYTKPVDTVFRAFGLDTRSGDSIYYFNTSLHCFGLRGQVFLCCQKKKRKKEELQYLVLAIHWFDMYLNNYSPRCRWRVIDILVALRLGKYPPIFTSTSKTIVLQCRTYNVLRTFECPAWLTIRTRESHFLTKKNLNKCKEDPAVNATYAVNCVS